MTDKYKEEFSRALKNVLSALPKDASADLKALAWQFYARLPLIDLEAVNPKEAITPVEEAYAFLRDALPPSPKSA